MNNPAALEIARDYVEYMRREGHNPYDAIKALSNELTGDDIYPDRWGVLEILVLACVLDDTKIDASKIEAARIRRNIMDRPIRAVR